MFSNLRHEVAAEHNFFLFRGKLQEMLTFSKPFLDPVLSCKNNVRFFRNSLLNHLSFGQRHSRVCGIQSLGLIHRLGAFPRMLELGRCQLELVALRFQFVLRLESKVAIRRALIEKAGAPLVSAVNEQTSRCTTLRSAHQHVYAIPNAPRLG